MDQTRHTYTIYVPAISIHDTLWDGIRGSILPKYGRIEDEVDACWCCAKFAQDWAIFSPNDGIHPYAFIEGDCQQLFTQEKEIPIVAKIELVWKKFDESYFFIFLCISYSIVLILYSCGSHIKRWTKSNEVILVSQCYKVSLGFHFFKIVPLPLIGLFIYIILSLGDIFEALRQRIKLDNSWNQIDPFLLIGFQTNRKHLFVGFDGQVWTLLIYVEVLHSSWEAF